MAQAQVQWGVGFQMDKDLLDPQKAAPCSGVCEAWEEVVTGRHLLYARSPFLGVADTPPKELRVTSSLPCGGAGSSQGSIFWLKSEGSAPRPAASRPSWDPTSCSRSPFPSSEQL